jgi:hypothetical protein
MCNKPAIKEGLDNISLAKAIPVVKRLLQEFGVFAAPVKKPLLTKSISTAPYASRALASASVHDAGATGSTSAVSVPVSVPVPVPVVLKAHKPGDVVNVLPRCWIGKTHILRHECYVKTITCTAGLSSLPIAYLLYVMCICTLLMLLLMIIYTW